MIINLKIQRQGQGQDNNDKDKIQLRFRITKNKCWILEDPFVVQGQCSFDFFNLELISFLINS
jgi:hypothetical protein